MNEKLLEILHLFKDSNRNHGMIKVSQLLEIENEIERLSFQRHSSWDMERKRLLIDSVMCGLPIPSIILTEEKGKIYCIDGFQRMKTLAAFYQNEFNSLNGSFFRNFPQDLKERYLDYSIPISFIDSKLDLPEIYIRLNSHDPLIKKGILYRDTFNPEIKKLAEHHFFQTHFPRRRQLEGYSIIEQLLTALALLFHIENNQSAINDYPNLSLKMLNKFIEDSIDVNRMINTNRLNKILSFLDVSSYSLSAIEKRKIYNKVDLIPICLVIDKLSGEKIDPIRFADKLREIYQDLQNEYGLLRTKNTKSIENNIRRVEILFEQFRGLIEREY